MHKSHPFFLLAVRVRQELYPSRFVLAICFVCACFFTSCVVSDRGQSTDAKANTNANASAGATPPNLSEDAIRERERVRKEDEKAELDSMDQFAAKFSIASLRKQASSSGAREIRIWIGTSPDRTRGLILTDNAARYLAPIGETDRGGVHDSKSLSPPETWEKFWSESEVLQLLDLAEELPAERVDPRLDSDVVIVEFKQGAGYRYILYGAPCHSKGAQAKNLVRVMKKIDELLGIGFYNCPSDPA